MSTTPTVAPLRPWAAGAGTSVRCTRCATLNSTLTPTLTPILTLILTLALTLTLTLTLTLNLNLNFTLTLTRRDAHAVHCAEREWYARQCALARALTGGGCSNAG